MRRTILMLVFLGALGDIAWAGPAEDIAAAGQRRTQAFVDGNLDAFVADVHDDAVLTVTTTGFRLQGKPAIRAFYANFFQYYTTRIVRGSQPPLTRTFANETVAVVNG